MRVASLICPSDLQNDTIPIPATQESGTGVSPGWSFNLIPSGVDAVFPLPPGNWLQAFTSYAGNAGDYSNVTGRFGLGPRNSAWDQAVRRVGGQLGGIERIPSRFSLFLPSDLRNRPW